MGTSEAEETSPVTEVPPSRLSADEAPPELEDGIALCLSGGGYRAMLYHVGSLIRLNEVGLLCKLRRISSVSGGSITSAALGMVWNSLDWDSNFRHVKKESFENAFVNKVRKLAKETIDVSSVSWGAFSPFSTISENVSKAYAKHLFGNATLQSLPDERIEANVSKQLPPAPRFIFVATNVKTGSLWRFAKPYMADYRVGMVISPRVSLADAVTASSAFPPFLSPMKFNLDSFDFKRGIPEDEANIPRSFRAEAVLTDGGVYDNMGLEAVWKRYKTVLVSDGGRRMDDDPSPADDWARHSRRLIDLLMHQVSNLRLRQLIGAFDSRSPDPHEGAYWGIQTNITDYNIPDALLAPIKKTLKIAAIPTRLAKMGRRDQERLINWGYAVCDAAIRRYQPELIDSPASPTFPYPNVGVS